MANRFWTYVQSLVPGRLARASEVNAHLEGIDEGFDDVEAEIDALTTAKDTSLTIPSGADFNDASITDGRNNKVAAWNNAGDPVLFPENQTRANKLLGWDTAGRLALRSLPSTLSQNFVTVNSYVFRGSGPSGDLSDVTINESIRFGITGEVVFANFPFLSYFTDAFGAGGANWFEYEATLPTGNDLNPFGNISTAGAQVMIDSTYYPSFVEITTVDSVVTFRIRPSAGGVFATTTGERGVSIRLPSIQWYIDSA